MPAHAAPMREPLVDAKKPQRLPPLDDGADTSPVRASPVVAAKLVSTASSQQPPSKVLSPVSSQTPPSKLSPVSSQTPSTQTPLSTPGVRKASNVPATAKQTANGGASGGAAKPAATSSPTLSASDTLLKRATPEPRPPLPRPPSVRKIVLDALPARPLSSASTGRMGSASVIPAIPVQPTTSEEIARAPENENLSMNEVLLQKMKVNKQRYLRVFLSSTFRGMEEERECLTKKYFKELRHQCEQAGIFLTIVDLRWGITEHAASNAETLYICLREIDDSDIFLGFYGERYGWHQPDGGATDELLQKNFDKMAVHYPWTDNFRDRSATEVEFLHGHLNNPRARPAFFFFRDPQWDNAMLERVETDEERIKYRAESPSAKAKLDALKQQVRDSKQAHVFDNYTDPEDGARKMYTVLHDLLAEIIEKAGLKADNETALHEAFMLSRAQVYVGGDAYMAVIDKHFAKARAPPLVVVGEPGTGKSALVANWIMRSFRQEVAPDECLVYHFMGSSEPSTRPGNVLRRLLLALAVALNVSGLQLPLDINDLRDKVAELLGFAAARKLRVTFVLDGLDQLEDRDGASELLWLPDGSAWEGHRLIISVAAHGGAAVRRGSSFGAGGLANSSFNPVTGSLNPLNRRSSMALVKRLSGTSVEDVHGSIERRVLDAIDRRDWTARLEVKPWGKDDLALFIRSVLRRAGKSLSETRKSPDKPSQMEVVLSAKQCCNPLYASLLLEELVAFGDFSQLDGYIERCLKCNDAVQLFEHVLTQLETEHRMEGTNIVEDVLVCLAVARYGLSEMEMLDILGIEQSLWSPIFYARRNFFVKRSGLLGFFHKQLLTAVERRYLANASSSKREPLLRRMVAYFSGKMRGTETGVPVEQRVVDELPWLLKALNDRDGMKACLTNLSMFQQMFDREKYELFSYWRFVGADGAEIARLYSESLKAAADKSKSALLYGLVGRFLQEYGFRLHALEFFEKELQISESEMGDRHPDVANALNNLAGIHSSNGQHELALPLYERALGIYENIYPEDHPDIASTLNNLAALYDEAGQYEDALPLYERSRAIYEAKFGKDHPDVATALNNIAGVYNMQELYDKALPLYERALEIYETNYGLEHPDVALALNNMAGMYDGQGLLDEAIPLYKRSLDIYEAKFGRDHPDVATALMNLAGVYNDMEAYEKAIPLYQRALDIREKKLGTDHIDYADTLNSLGTVYFNQEDFAMAKTLFEKALEIRVAKLGEDDPHTQATREALRECS